MLEPVRPGAESPDRALCLPTFSHFVIANKRSLSLSFYLSLSFSLSLSCLELNKTSLSFSLSLSCLELQDALQQLAPEIHPNTARFCPRAGRLRKALRKAFQKGRDESESPNKRYETAKCSNRAETSLSSKKGGSEVAKSGGCTVKTKIRKIVETKRRLQTRAKGWCDNGLWVSGLGLGTPNMFFCA